MVANRNKENFRGEKSIFEWSNRTIWKELWDNGLKAGGKNIFSFSTIPL